MRIHKGSFVWKIAFLILAMILCSRALPLSFLRHAGGNWLELRKVVIRYRKEGDEEKIRAVRFLMSNIQYHSYPYSDAMVEAKVWYRLMRERSKSEMPSLRDSLLMHINASEPLRLRWDVRDLDSAYLCENIDWAFKVWREQPWGKNVSFDMFCEYILPYRIADEVPEYWRKEYYDKYNPLLDEFRDSGLYDTEDPVAALKYLIDRLPYIYKPVYTTQAFITFPHVGPEYVQYVSGTCREFSDFVIYVCRALGIPAAYNETLNMHRVNKGHCWASFWNKDMQEYIISNYPPVLVPNRLDYTMGAEKCKVYRKAYSVNPDVVKKSRKSRMPLEPYFRFPTYTDVTDVYTKRYVPEVLLPADSLRMRVSRKDPIYICSPVRNHWRAEDFSFIRNGYIRFENLQAGEVMCLCVKTDQGMEPVSNPFLIDNKSHEITFFNPGTSFSEVVLTSKFKPISQEQMFRDRMVGGVFEVSYYSDFRKTDTLHVISRSPYRKYTVVSVNDDANEYRYIRYKGPAGSYCNIADVTYFTRAGEKIEPEMIFGTSSDKRSHDYLNVYDGSSRTSFDYTYPDGGWSGVRLPDNCRVGLIAYTPRNHDNFINQGDVYELFYFDSGWKSLGMQTAESDSLSYAQVPSGALLFLKNHSSGVQERIFTYDDCHQVWR